MVTVQVVDLSSFQDATTSFPILSSLPEIVIEGPEMMFIVLLDTVIVGGVVSFSGVGGLTGVTGVTGSGSSPQQATMKDSARIEKSILTGLKRCFFMA